MLYTGWFFAFISGAALPFFFIALGAVIDVFDPDTPKEQIVPEVKKMVILFCIVAAILWISVYLYYMLLLSFAIRVSQKIKVAYLNAVL